MTKRFLWIMAPLAVLSAVSVAQAAMLQYDLQVVNAEGPGATIVNAKHVTFSPNADPLNPSYVQMALYTSIDMTGGGASASNYGYAGGSMDILSGVTGAFSKLHGEISVNLVATGGWQTATPRSPPNQTKIA